MSNEADVLAVLNRLNIPVIGSIISDSNRTGHYLIRVSVERNDKNHQTPSNRELEAARVAIRELGSTVEFLLTDHQAQDIEAGLRATLLHEFGNEIRNVFFSANQGSGFVWIEQKRELSGKVREQMERKATVYLDLFDLKLVSLSYTTDENLPSKLAILNVIRRFAPINSGDLRAVLVERRFIVPSDDWLNRRLDTMRKSASIVRLSNGTYVLSLESIHNLGTVKSGKSPDVSRLLALARKSR